MGEKNIFIIIIIIMNQRWLFVLHIEVRVLP